MSIKFIAFIAFALAVTFTLVLVKQQQSELWSWWTSLVSTLVSVLLGVIVGLTLFTHSEKRTAGDQKARTLAVLTAELSDTKRILSSEPSLTITVNESRLPVLLTYVQPLAIEEAATSGLLDAVQTENLLHLARKMRMFNVKTQYLLALLAGSHALQGERGEAFLGNATRNLEETRASILEGIELATEQLQIDLSPSSQED